MLGFASPWAFLALPLALLPLVPARNLRRGLPLPSLRWLPPGLAHHCAARTLPALRAAAMALLIVVLARPQLPGGWQTDPHLGVDLMLALDISGSMRAEDFQPDNRITAAKRVLEEFISHEHGNRMGLVIFAGRPSTVCPLTEDTQAVEDALSQVSFDSVSEDGTAIGDAIGTCLYRLADRAAKSRAIILLTDGENNSGYIDPIAAAKMAAVEGVKVYTVGVGRPGGAPIPIYDAFGRKDVLRMPDGRPFLPQIAEQPLKEIAAITGGEYFRATDTAALEDIYGRIAQMERSDLGGDRHRTAHDIGWIPLATALLALGSEFLLAQLRWNALSAVRS